MCCCLTSCDTIFLAIMTTVTILIILIDLRVLEKMFEEYFLVKHFLDVDTYSNCYSPQAQMRMCFECYVIYCAALCTCLTGALTFNVGDEVIKWIARKVINISFLVFGPILFVLCSTGIFNIKSLSNVCSLKGIIKG